MPKYGEFIEELVKCFSNSKFEGASEVRALLSTVFPHQRAYSRDKHCWYTSNDDAGDDFALKVSYTRAGAVSAIAPGPRLTDQQVEKIRLDIKEFMTAPGHTKVCRTILFSDYTTKGAWAKPGVFQLLEAPADAPRPQFSFGRHPLIFEFQFNATNNETINSSRLRRVQSDWCLFLHLVLEGRTGWLPRSVISYWVLASMSPGRTQTQYCQSYYEIPSFIRFPEGFTDQADLTPFQVIEHNSYFSDRGVQLDRSLAVPNIFDQLINSFVLLQEPRREKFIRSMHWYWQSRQVELSTSASFVSLVTAIESLVDDPKVAGACDACGRDKVEKGAKTLFKDFLENYAREVPKVTRDMFYSWRSNISHGDLLSTDFDGFGFGGLDPIQLEEMKNHRALSHVVRVALINWLLASSANVDNGR